MTNRRGRTIFPESCTFLIFLANYFFLTQGTAGMSRSSHFDQLRDAVQKELSDEELCANRCDSFLEKIIQYQSGQGALPDEQQFLVWREDLKKALALCALKAGMDLPDQDAPASDDAPTALRQSMLPSRGRYHGGMDSPASGGAPKK